MVQRNPAPVSAPAQQTREVQAWLQAQVQVLVQALVQAPVQVQARVLVTQSQQQLPWRRAGERRSAIGLPWCWR